MFVVTDSLSLYGILVKCLYGIFTLVRTWNGTGWNGMGWNGTAGEEHDDGTTRGIVGIGGVW